jgi:hypothetical protein
MADLLNLTTSEQNHMKAYHDGTHVSTFYTNTFNSTKDLEYGHFTNELPLYFPTTQPGNNVLAYIPTTFQFVRDLTLQINISATGGDVTLPRNFTGYSLIETFQYRVPGSPLITIDGDALVYHVLSTVDNESKKKSIKSVSTLPTSTQNQIDTLQVSLPFPWTSFKNHRDKMKPFWNYGTVQSSANGLEISIKMRGKSDLTASANTITINALKLWFEYGKLSNDMQLVRGLLKYPCFFPYDFKYPFSPDLTSTGNQYVEHSVSINGLRTGETNHLMLSFNPFCFRDKTILFERYSGIKLAKLRVQFSGQTIFDSDDGILEIWDSKYSDIVSVNECNIKPRTIPDLHSGAIGLAALSALLDTYFGNLDNYLKLMGIKNANATIPAFGATASAAWKVLYDYFNAYYDIIAKRYGLDTSLHINIMSGNWATGAGNGSLGNELEAIIENIYDQFGEAFGNPYGLKTFPFFYYKIPVAQNINVSHDYHLGGDFRGQELKIYWTPYLYGNTTVSNLTGEVLIIQNVNGMYQSIKGLSSMIQ